MGNTFTPLSYVVTAASSLVGFLVGTEPRKRT